MTTLKNIYEFDRKKWKWPEVTAGIFGFISFTFILIQIQMLISVESYNPGFVSFFDLNKEKNVPAVFAALALLLSAILLLVITIKENNSKRYFWLVLSLIFFLLSADELLSFHERLIKPVRNYFSVSGYLYFAWVIPYGIATAIITVLFFRFIFALPRRTKWLIIFSGIIYIIGALGFELLGGKQYVLDGEIQTLEFRILYTIEETFEMLGAVLFVYSLSDYLRRIRHLRVVNVLNYPNIFESHIESNNRKTGTYK